MTNARSVHCPQHPHQVGVCPACQRARLEAEKEQLAEVDAVRHSDLDFDPVDREPTRQTM